MDKAFHASLCIVSTGERMRDTGTILREGHVKHFVASNR